jgi:LysM repeat protein
MNKEEPYRNQAEKNRQRIERTSETTVEERVQLPPREQVHREKRKKSKTKLKLKYPVIRILVLFFILLPIVIFSVYTYLEGGVKKDTEKVSNDSSGYEVINFEKKNTETKDKPVEEEIESTEADEVKEEEVQVEDTIESSDENTNVNQEVIETGGVADKNSGGQVETPITNESAPPENPEKIVYHTVQKGENLYRIALKYYQSKAGEEKIRKANNLKGDEIYLGQVLKIPLEQ